MQHAFCQHLKCLTLALHSHHHTYYTVHPQPATTWNTEGLPLQNFGPESVTLPLLLPPTRGRPTSADAMQGQQQVYCSQNKTFNKTVISDNAHPFGIAVATCVQHAITNPINPIQFPIDRYIDCHCMSTIVLQTISNQQNHFDNSQK